MKFILPWEESTAKDKYEYYCCSTAGELVMIVFRKNSSCWLIINNEPYPISCPTKEDALFLAESILKNNGYEFVSDHNRCML